MGALAMILAGMTLAPVGLLMGGVPTAPARNLEFAQGANSPSWRLGMALSAISMAFLLLGMIAAYAYLARTRAEGWALAGLIMTVGFVTLMLPVTGFAAYVVPAVGRMVEQGQTEFIQIMDQTFKEPYLVIPFFAGILWNVGMILIGIAVVRSGTLPVWVGVLYMIYGVLGIPAFLDITLLQRFNPLIGGAAHISLGIMIWRAVAAG